jgi:hypothetical protein
VSVDLDEECEHGEYADECGFCEAEKLRVRVTELEGALRGMLAPLPNADMQTCLDFEEARAKVARKALGEVVK